MNIEKLVMGTEFILTAKLKFLPPVGQFLPKAKIVSTTVPKTNNKESSELFQLEMKNKARHKKRHNAQFWSGLGSGGLGATINFSLPASPVPVTR